MSPVSPVIIRSVKAPTGPALSHHILSFYATGTSIECWGQNKDTGVTTAISTFTSLPWTPAVGQGTDPGDGIRERCVLMHSDPLGNAGGPSLVWLEPAQSAIAFWDIVNNTFATVNIDPWGDSAPLGVNGTNQICANVGDGFVYQSVRGFNVSWRYRLERYDADGGSITNLFADTATAAMGPRTYDTDHVWVRVTGGDFWRITYAGVKADITPTVSTGTIIGRNHYAITTTLGAGGDAAADTFRRSTSSTGQYTTTALTADTYSGRPGGGLNIARDVFGVYPFDNTNKIKWFDIQNTVTAGSEQATVVTKDSNQPHIALPHNVTVAF